jgi:response regulator of citrate/malate metabolism
MTDQTPDDDDAPAEYPSGSDVPNELLTARDIDPFSVETDSVDDVNELATEEWKASTTAEERIRAVIGRTTSPKSAREIAETAAVSETKARTMLNRLATDGIVRTYRSDTGTRYERDPD